MFFKNRCLAKKFCDNEVNYGQKSNSFKTLKVFLTTGGEHVLYQTDAAGCFREM